MGISDIIKNAIQITGHHPFLFVGSGISKRYLNTEKWDELLKVFCTEFSGNDGNLSVSRVIELEGSDYAYRKLIFLTEDEMNCSELLKYLQTLLKNNSPKLLHGNPELKRLIRMYDLLRYK